MLSPSNEGLDWQRKLEEYRGHPAIAYILLIESRYQAATLLTRDGEAWTSTDADHLTETFELPAIGCHLEMSAIYDGLDLPPLPKAGSGSRVPARKRRAR